MTYQLIEFSVDAGVATIALNRPDRRNAMSDDMRSEFIRARAGRRRQGHPGAGADRRRQGVGGGDIRVWGAE